MKFIAALSVLLASTLLFLLFFALGLIDLTGLPVRFWFITSVLISTILFGIKFKSLGLFKIYLLRKKVEIDKLYNKIDKKILVKKNTITPLQEKSIKLWKLCLKDKNVTMSCSIQTHERQIKKNNILIILYPHSLDYYIMTIFDVNADKHCLYEVQIPEEYVKNNNGIVTAFDNEMEKRLRSGETNIRKMIDDDLCKLIEEQEKANM
jgi:hypothetical protein